MAERTPIINVSGDHEETFLQLAKHLGINKLRRRIFNTIYGPGSRPRSKRQIMRIAKILERDSQQAQNALDHLAKHHLIVRVNNDGSVKDGSRYLYQKDESVRANRSEVIKYADNPHAAKSVPTKRRPQVRGIQFIRTITRMALRKKKRVNVLYLTANPYKRHSLRVDAEVGQVQEAIRGSVYRDNIKVEYRPAASLKTLIEGLNDHRPQIVHFSGHGYKGGVVVDNPGVKKRPAETVSFELFSRAISATDAPPEIIVLNACESAGAQKALLPPAKIVVVMRDSISDVAATAFAVKFYAAIAAGQSVKSAFAQGKVAIEQVSLNEVDTPELLVAQGVDPAKVVLT
jgi:predicted transcriptional regulator